MNNKIYFAGKISKYNWRNQLLNKFRIDEEDEPYIIDEFEYTGPFFISCDHGCYHGDNTHGRLIDENAMCSDFHYETRGRTISKCYKWIDEADIVFCWIDDITAYGTFTEIGYAFAKNKIIYIACDEKISKESIEIWFPLLSSNVLVYEDNIEKAWSNFTKWHNDGMKKSSHKIPKKISESQYYFILNLLENSRYELVDESIDLRNIDSGMAGKIIAVLKNKNKTIEDYDLSHVLRLKQNLNEKEPFFYIEKPGIIKTQISNFLKKTISFKKDENSLVDLSYVNNIDRVKIAEEFVDKIISEKSHSFISGENNLDLFIEDVAKRIDSIIPRQYYVEFISLLYPEFPNGFITDNFLGKNHYEFTKDLIYKYEENNEEVVFASGLIDNRINIYKDYDRANSILQRTIVQKEKKKLAKMSKEERFAYKKQLRQKNNEKIPPTQAQLDFLIILADKNGYSIKNIDELDMDTSSDLIDSFKKGSNIPADILNKFIEINN